MTTELFKAFQRLQKRFPAATMKDLSCMLGLIQTVGWQYQLLTRLKNPEWIDQLSSVKALLIAKAPHSLQDELFKHADLPTEQFQDYSTYLVRSHKA